MIVNHHFNLHRNVKTQQIFSHIHIKNQTSYNRESRGRHGGAPKLQSDKRYQPI